RKKEFKEFLKKFSPKKLSKIKKAKKHLWAPYSQFIHILTINENSNQR
ncbi:11632_t:CDS:1, partial [Gigaspora margarita]